MAFNTFANSIAGKVGSALWSGNPLLVAGIAGSVAAGAYAGAHTFATADGTPGERAESSVNSGIKYTVGGMAAFGALAIGAKPSFDYLSGKGTRETGQAFGKGVRGAYEHPWESTKGAGRATGRAAARAAKPFKEYGAKVAGSYSEGSLDARYAAFAEAEKPLGRFGMGMAGVKGGVLKVMEERKGLMIAGGAGIGAMIGSKLDKDDPRRGAMKGAAIGGGAGLAISHGIRASRVWNKLGAGGKGVAIGALSVLAFGAAAIAGRPRGAVDVAQREDYSMQDRMNAIGATGSVTLGLHNAR